jgi:hypothetical protein
VETATQTLHRLTSFGADVYDHQEWFAPPVDDPRVVQEFVPNDPARRPWHFKRYAQPLPAHRASPRPASDERIHRRGARGRG